MTLTIEPAKRWDAPEGTFDATFYEIKEVNDKRTNKRMFRMVWQIEDFTSPSEIMCAARNFEPTLACGSELRKALVSWLGEELMGQYIKSGQFDFDLLKERKARLEIVHLHNESYPRPFVMIESILPPGISKYEHAGDGI